MQGSPAVTPPKPNKDNVHLCQHEVCQRGNSKGELPIPTVDEVLEEMNGRMQFFPSLTRTWGFIKLNLRRGRGISQHFQLVIH